MSALKKHIQALDLAVQPKSGEHPRDAALRRIEALDLATDKTIRIVKNDAAKALNESPLAFREAAQNATPTVTQSQTAQTAFGPDLTVPGRAATPAAKGIAGSSTKPNDPQAPRLGA